MNGRTTPGRLALRGMVMRAGGHFETYFSDRVTHVVADNVAAATARRLQRVALQPRRVGGAVRMVTGAWVARCVAEGRRVAEARFPIEGVARTKLPSVAAWCAGAKGEGRGKGAGAGGVAEKGIAKKQMSETRAPGTASRVGAFGASITSRVRKAKKATRWDFSSGAPASKKR